MSAMATSTGPHQAVTLVGDPTPSYPLIICFHGSGDSCASWAPVADFLRPSYQVLLWDRGPLNPKPDSTVREMQSYLKRSQLSPPYVLIAHSYGGTFARLFLQLRPKDVAGMVLVETGQETELGAGVEQEQYRKQIMENKPLVVIRGNTLIGKWKQYEEERAIAGSDAAMSRLVALKQLLDASDQEDERLKKAQLALSRNHRYLHIPDCGHDVIQQKPEVVAQEVHWVMENLQPAEERTNLHIALLAWLRKLRKKVGGGGKQSRNRKSKPLLYPLG